MTLPYQKSFNHMGYALLDFIRPDDRADDPESDIPYRYYAAKDGKIHWKFKTLGEAGEWIAARLAF